MSSNPFRRSLAVKPSPAISFVDEQQQQGVTARPGMSVSSSAVPKLARRISLGDPFTNATTVTPPQQPKQKRVQIQTPPHSPETPITTDDGIRSLSASFGRTGSPPPPPVSGTENDREADLFRTSDLALIQAQINARRNSAGFEPSPSTVPTASSTRAPYNPFARTLATTEASYGLQPKRPEELEVSQPRAGKPAIDVDTFKDILLTGSAPPPPVVEAVATEAPPASSTFPSHASESRTEVRSRSPRTSFPDQQVTLNDRKDPENVRPNLVEADRPAEIAVRAPPKPRGRGPQTVSFADFDQSIPSVFPSSGPHTPSSSSPSMSGILRGSRSRSPNTLNKPLPTPPIPRASSVEKSSSSSQRPTPSRASSDDSAHQKKVPPPPPTSRRQAAGPGRPRSTSNATQSSTTSVAESSDSDSSSDEEFTNKAVPPPPPPARKSQTSTTDAPKPAPRPPPPRSHAKASAQSTPSRTSLELSRSSAAAPPVPPHRRSGGSRPESLHSRPASVRTSSRDSELAQARSSEPNIEPLTSRPTTAAEPSGDVPADMSAFHAEIDALWAEAGSG